MKVIGAALKGKKATDLYRQRGFREKLVQRRNRRKNLLANSE
jgi:hypothetical protein